MRLELTLKHTINTLSKMTQLQKNLHTINSLFATHTNDEPGVFESMVTSVVPDMVSPDPFCTTTSHRIMTVVSLSGVNSSTNMSVGLDAGKETFN